MSKIAFFCIPAEGHTNPTLPVVKRLIDDNHQVRYYSFNSMKDKIEETGAEFIACDEYDPQTDFTQEEIERIPKDMEFATEVIVDTTLAMEEALYQGLSEWNPDCIVADSMAFWGKLAALKLGIPFISSTTTFAFNKFSAKDIRPESGGLIKSLMDMNRANKQVKRLKRAGYNVKNVLSIVANDNDTETIVYTSPQFQPCAETFSDKYTFIGPSIEGIDEAIPRTEKPSIYISLGTVLNNNFDFYKNCIDTFKETDMKVVISVGETFGIESLGEIPSNIRVERRVDQVDVLQRIHIFITHCGMNSVNEALFCGTPLVLFPQTPEQRVVAERVKTLGAGVLLKDNTAESIAEAVDELLTKPEYREKAREIAESFKDCGGPEEAVEKILEIAGSKTENNR